MSKLKLASDEQFSNLRPTPLPPSEDIEGEFELEKILDHDEKRKMYYCKWKNYDEIYRSTWEPRAHLAEGKTRAQTKLLDDYEKRHNLVALSSEGEAESVASRLLDQSKNRKRKRSEWTPRPIPVHLESHWYKTRYLWKPLVLGLHEPVFETTCFRTWLFEDKGLKGGECHETTLIKSYPRS